MNKISLVLVVFIIMGCANKMLQFEQYSVAINQQVSADSSIYLGDEEKFQGVIWISPILQEEKAQIKSVKFIRNYGNYYLCAENFKNVWMITPQEDGMTGSYKALDITPDDTTDVLTGISFSRYGSKDKTCVKFRFNDKEVFIDRKGNINEKCE